MIRCLESSGTNKNRGPDTNGGRWVLRKTEIDVVVLVSEIEYLRIFVLFSDDRPPNSKAVVLSKYCRHQIDFADHRRVI